MCTAKYILFDCEGGNKVRKDQIVVYCTHGAGGFKSIKGRIIIPKYVDYILTESKKYLPIQAKEWNLSEDDKRYVFIGYPSHDVFFNNLDYCEIKKIIPKKYKKVVLWMPTFRKGGGFKRNDSTKEQKLGIPLLSNYEEYKKINKYLNDNNIYLIIKIHPKQDLTNLKIKSLSNIIVLTAEEVKKYDIDNYRLMKNVDALITDYSTVGFEFLQLNKPIAYVLDDVNEYKIGFAMDNIYDFMAGKQIYNINDFIEFITDVNNEKDDYLIKRIQLRDYIFEYHDGKSSERLANLLGLKNK